MSRLIEKYLRGLFDEKKVSQEYREQLWQYYYDKLSKGVDEGYSPKSLHYDKDLADAFKYNIAEFSAFKETAFRKQVESLLVDEQGGLRSWSDFKKEAYKVSGDYNHRWLETEYHQTIANANMAEKWKGFEANADLYPNLKLVSVGDASARPGHKALDGTIRPISDPFWKTHTPPLDWGCRCDIIQTDEDPTEIKGGLQLKMEFENNPALTGKIFGKSVYMTSGGLNPEMIEEIGRFAKRMYNKTIHYAQNYASYLKHKKNADYFDVSFDKKTGGMKATHRLHSFHPKMGHYEEKVRDILFKNGNKVILAKEKADIGEIIKDGQKHIDGYINDLSFDISTILGDGKNTIKKAFQHSYKKNAKVPILYFPDKENYSAERVYTGLKMYRGSNNYEFEEILIIVNDKVIKL